MIAIDDLSDNDYYEDFPSAGLNRQHPSGVDTAQLLRDVDKSLKQLVQPGTYGTRYQRSMWVNRFQAFRQQTLRIEYVRVCLFEMQLNPV